MIFSLIILAVSFQGRNSRKNTVARDGRSERNLAFAEG